MVIGSGKIIVAFLKISTVFSYFFEFECFFIILFFGGGIFNSEESQNIHSLTFYEILSVYEELILPIRKLKKT